VRLVADFLVPSPNVDIFGNYGDHSHAELITRFPHEKLTVRRRLTNSRSDPHPAGQSLSHGGFSRYQIPPRFLRNIEAQTVSDDPESSGFNEADEKVLEQLRARFPIADPDQ
jgi:hypothetical protein